MAKSKKVVKTNAVRLVEQRNIPYTVISYDISDDLIDGVSVAKKTGQAVATVLKTLVTKANNQEIFVFLIPVALELDLKKAAKVAKVKRIELLPLQELTKETGYIRGGCSPIGMKKLYPTFIEQSAESIERVTISAGKPGLQMTITLDHLMALTNATLANLRKELT